LPFGFSHLGWSLLFSGKNDFGSGFLFIYFAGFDGMIAGGGGELSPMLRDTINRKPAFPELPANRTYRRHGQNDANDPSGTLTYWNSAPGMVLYMECDCL
jgi:hypothetical protein